MAIVSDALLRTQDRPRDLLDVITRYQLDANLKLCLDAGDAASYSGTGQQWLDLSGNGHNFNRGNTASAGSDDPTFNGVSGRKSAAEYWSFDGGDWFNLAAANSAWMNNIHKKNARFSVCAWFYFLNTASKTLFMTRRGSTDHGFSLSAGNDLRFFASAGNGNIVELESAGQGVELALNRWCFVSASIDEAGGASASFLMVDGKVAAFNGQYSANSSSNASYSLRMAGNGGSIYLPNGSRMASLAAWEGRCLTAAEMTDVFNATRDKFGV